MRHARAVDAISVSPPLACVCVSPDDYPTTQTLDNIVIIVLCLIAALVWTTILAVFCDLTQKENPEYIHPMHIIISTTIVAV